MADPMPETSKQAFEDAERLTPCARAVLRFVQSSGAALRTGMRQILRATYMPDPSESFTPDETRAAVTELLALDLIEAHDDMPLPAGEIGTGYALSNWGFFVASALAKV